VPAKTIIRDVGRTRYVAHLRITDGYFSLTGELYEPHGTRSGAAQHRNGREPDMGGAMGDTLARVIPELEPFARVHLSSLDGTPMHAKANAGYFYSGAHESYEIRHYGEGYVRRNGTGHERAARTLRVDAADLPTNLSPGAFDAFVDDRREQWWHDAMDAMRVFESIPGA
jgi:hypothetical protein